MWVAGSRRGLLHSNNLPCIHFWCAPPVDVIAEYLYCRKINYVLPFFVGEAMDNVGGNRVKMINSGSNSCARPNCVTIQLHYGNVDGLGARAGVVGGEPRRVVYMRTPSTEFRIITNEPEDFPFFYFILCELIFDSHLIFKNAFVPRADTFFSLLRSGKSHNGSSRSAKCSLFSPINDGFKSFALIIPSSSSFFLLAHLIKTLSH